MEGPDICKIACTGPAPAGGSLAGVSAPFRHRLRVRWVECDIQGIVFYGHYLTYFDIAITELYRDAIGSWSALADHNADLVVAEAGIRYRASARFDDEIDVIASIRHLGSTSVVTDMSIERVADGALLVEGDLRHVFVDPVSLAKREMPAPIRSRLERYLATPGAVS